MYNFLNICKTKLDKFHPKQSRKLTPLCKLNIRWTTEKKKRKPADIRAEIHIEHVNKQRVSKLDQQSYIAESKKEIKQPTDNSLCHPTSNKITCEPDKLSLPQFAKHVPGSSIECLSKSSKNRLIGVLKCVQIWLQ